MESKHVSVPCMYEMLARYMLDVSPRHSFRARIVCQLQVGIFQMVKAKELQGVVENGDEPLMPMDLRNFCIVRVQEGPHWPHNLLPLLNWNFDLPDKIMSSAPHWSNISIGLLPWENMQVGMIVTSPWDAHHFLASWR